MRAAGADALTPLKSANEYLLFPFQTRSLCTASLSHLKGVTNFKMNCQATTGSPGFTDVCGNCEKSDQVKSLTACHGVTWAAQEHGDVGNATGLGAAIALDQVHFIRSSSGSPSAGPPGSRLRLSCRTSKR
jgi:hypothetical protein